MNVVNQIIKSGAGDAASITIRAAISTLENDLPVELWIAYLWSSRDTPTDIYEHSNFLKLEMMVIVTTRAPYLYTWHMGITGNWYWVEAPHVIVHSCVSDLFHAFAAHVMRKENPKLYYVCSGPNPAMENILKKVFVTGHTVFFS